MTTVNEKQIDGKTKLVGLLATPIGHSLSPRMHNLGYSLKGLNYAYLAFEVGNEELEETVKGFKAAGVAGFNVSMPNKMKILDYLDELDDSAKYSGASNTVVNRDGKLIGYNTDGLGYIKNLIEHGVELKDQKVTLVGSGGAATPIAIQFAQSSASSTILKWSSGFIPRLVPLAKIALSATSRRNTSLSSNGKMFALTPNSFISLLM